MVSQHRIFLLIFSLYPIFLYASRTFSKRIPPPQRFSIISHGIPASSNREIVEVFVKSSASPSSHCVARMPHLYISQRTPTPNYRRSAATFLCMIIFGRAVTGFSVIFIKRTSFSVSYGITIDFRNWKSFLIYLRCKQYACGMLYVLYLSILLRLLCIFTI